MSVGPFGKDKTKDKTLRFITLSPPFRLAHLNWCAVCVCVCGSGLGGLRVSVSVTASDTLSSVLQISSQWQKENTRQWKVGPYGDVRGFRPTTRSVLHCGEDLTQRHESCLFTFKHP